MRRFVAALLLTLAAATGRAEDNALLIQTRPDGTYQVWHGDGETHLTEDEVLDLSASARPEGGTPVTTGRGPARAYEMKDGSIRVDMPEAAADRQVLLDRDACGGLKVWHAEGTTQLTEDQLTDLVIAAMPGGGKRVKVGAKHAKSFTTPVGVVATLWTPLPPGERSRK